MKNKSVQNCRFVHHAKFHCIMTTLKELFKIKFERGGGTGKEPKLFIIFIRKFCGKIFDLVRFSTIDVSFAVLKICFQQKSEKSNE